FNGDRMAKLSRDAWLFFSPLFTLSDGYGRLELNPRKIVQAFAGLRHSPTEQELVRYLCEYHESFLLFVYEVGGQYWGQWVTSERFLPRYKTGADQRSPIPPGLAFEAWKDKYTAS